MSNGNQRAIVLVGPEFEDSELMYPMLRLKEAGLEVVLAGIGKDTYAGKRGQTVTVQGQCEDFRDQNWDLVVVPGGWAPDKVRTDTAALDIVRQANSRRKVVAAICHAGWVLASADIVRGRTLTSYPGIRDDLVNAGASWVDEEVVVDGNLVTSRRPDDLPAFCRAILKCLEQR